MTEYRDSENQGDREIVRQIEGEAKRHIEREADK